ncbi:hypothetical protein GCM10022223_13910 [Kineosporia mesophila]|uniref:Uncharacterized protein n=1 Tax=Kineosporia mesophila TaxID=566012 RepID=A0ABP6ZAF8_9ACTN|nr:hypothetical protein [Kineosporia mesophila]MCD5354802.1 hypothetical protein [Kineosporia mesophila]
MDFFPEPPAPPEEDLDEEREDHIEPEWLAAPVDVLPGVVPLEVVIGRSDSTVVTLTGVRAFATGLAMYLNVLVRGRLGADRDLNAEVFDGPYPYRDRRAGGLKWGFELADGRRATNVDARDDLFPDSSIDGWTPSHPVLNGRGGSGSHRSVQREQWLWPLPPPGRLRIVCQWDDQDIEVTVTDLEAGPFIEAAARAVPLWPSAPA